MGDAGQRNAVAYQMMAVPMNMGMGGMGYYQGNEVGSTPMMQGPPMYHATPPHGPHPQAHGPMIAMGYPPHALSLPMRQGKSDRHFRRGDRHRRRRRRYDRGDQLRRENTSSSEEPSNGSNGERSDPDGYFARNGSYTVPIAMMAAMGLLPKKENEEKQCEPPVQEGDESGNSNGNGSEAGSSGSVNAEEGDCGDGAEGGCDDGAHCGENEQQPPSASPQPQPQEAPAPQPQSVAGQAYPVAPLDNTQLMHALCTQLEYYFSVENLVKDLFLRNNMDSRGYIDVGVLAHFNRILQLTNDKSMILRAARESPQLKVKGERVRVRNEPQKWVFPPGQCSLSNDDSEDEPEEEAQSQQTQ